MKFNKIYKKLKVFLKINDNREDNGPHNQFIEFLLKSPHTKILN